jgi:hypothetical protein
VKIYDSWKKTLHERVIERSLQPNSSDYYIKAVAENVRKLQEQYEKDAASAKVDNGAYLGFEVFEVYNKDDFDALILDIQKFFENTTEIKNKLLQISDSYNSALPLRNRFVGKITRGVRYDTPGPVKMMDLPSSIDFVDINLCNSHLGFLILSFRTVLSAGFSDRHFARFDKESYELVFKNLFLIGEWKRDRTTISPEEKMALR